MSDEYLIFVLETVDPTNPLDEDSVEAGKSNKEELIV